MPLSRFKPCTLYPDIMILYYHRIANIHGEQSWISSESKDNPTMPAGYKRVEGRTPIRVDTNNIEEITEYPGIG